MVMGIKMTACVIYELFRWDWITFKPLLKFDSFNDLKSNTQDAIFTQSYDCFNSDAHDSRHSLA